MITLPLSASGSLLVFGESPAGEKVGIGGSKQECGELLGGAAG